jgi:group I intron endonuclease
MSQIKDRYLVYALVDPRNGEIRYVGKSSNGLKRPKAHFYPSSREKLKLPVYHWINKLIKLGMTPTIEILEESQACALPHVKMYYINLCKKEGNRLLNMTDGGEGTTGRKVSEKTKNKLSLLYKGRKLTEEQKKKIKISKIGKKLTEQQKLNIAKSSPRNRAVICMETQKEYRSIREASRNTKIDRKGIERCCKGIYSQYKGYKWQFL